MRPKPLPSKTTPGERVVKDIPARDAAPFFCRRQDQDRAGRAARRGQYCRTLPQGRIAQSLYYVWSKEFLEAASAAWRAIPPGLRLRTR